MPGTLGEITVRTPLVMTGYWSDPAGTGAALEADGWLRTGDTGFVDGDGWLYVQDRLKDMIISGGENIYPAEIENVIAGLPGIAEVCVVGVPHERWGETPVAVVVATPAAEIDDQAVLDWCRKRLAHFKCPTRVIQVRGLPKNGSGKVSKMDVRQAVAALAQDGTAP
jgi:acyl-CoA synthetase (AMP-forming)/AMP-acid ligase II